MNDLPMPFVKPPFFNILKQFRRPANLLSAVSILIVVLLAVFVFIELPYEDEFGLKSPVVPSRIVQGHPEGETQVATIAGTVSTTFSAEMSGRNMASLTEKVKKLLASKIDLDRASAKGASYRIIYEEHRIGGTQAAAGDILAIEVTLGKRQFNAYRFTDAHGRVSYYDERGLAVLNQPLFRQPCDYDHVSSEFGYRKHPISRMIRFHGGVDLAAPYGTPVRAVADGTVAFRGRNGGAGNMITLSHAGRMDTQYLHLSRVSPACTLGNRVRQGDVIGYVGSSGSSTGPHLDFRVIVDGVLRNPLAALKTPAPKHSLTMAELAGMLAKIDLYKEQLDNSQFRVASISGRPTVTL